MHSIIYMNYLFHCIYALTHTQKTPKLLYVLLHFTQLIVRKNICFSNVIQIFGEARIVIHLGNPAEINGRNLRVK